MKLLTRRFLKIKNNKIKINDKIKASKVRLIDENGNQCGIQLIQDALAKANNAELDLVEISPNSEPPVCKILNFGKYKYDREKQKKNNKKKQHIIHVKEVRLRLNTGDNDLLIKLKKAQKFLKNGDKLKVTVMFRGREIQRKDIGIEMLTKVQELLSDISKVDKEPNLEGKRLSLILSPK